MITLSAATTALILIDLQKGIVGLPTEPYPPKPRSQKAAT